ncbi:MAG: hypothetical protein IJ720_00955 [Clostridia bacterium]|nr:hypothetical protein [Clostridia bacterium]MBR1703915.1 hypothetical protein [Clostridia bacterium]
MARNHTPRGDYYRERANREAEDEFFDAPAEYRNNFENTQAEARKNKEAAVFDREERRSGRGAVVAIVLVGLVAILAVLLAAYYMLMNQGKVPEVGPLTTTTTTAVTTEVSSLDTLEDGTLPGEDANIVINGTTVRNTSNAGGGSARLTTVTASNTNAYVNSGMTAAQVQSMVNRQAAGRGNVLIWDNIVEDDSDLNQYNYTYQAAYYRVTSEKEDIHAIQKNTVYIFLTATNKDPSQEEKGMLVLHGENVYKQNGNLVAEYMEGEMDRYSDASSFISSYMAGKSGFTKVS